MALPHTNLDANAKSGKRVRRNWANVNKGGATALVSTAPPIVLNGTGALTVQLLSTGGLQLVGASLSVKLNPAGALSVGASGIAVEVDGTSVTITGNKLAVVGGVYVPYTGATSNVDLGSHTLTTSGLTTVTGFLATDSKFRVGSLEFQPYSQGNIWFGDNIYYNGTNFKYRATGTAAMFYFFGAEGQFRLAVSGSAGASVPLVTPFKVNANGSAGLGGAIDESSGGFAGALIFVDGSTGFVGFGTNAPIAGLSMKNGDSSAGFSVAQISMGYGGTTSYSQFIHTRHNTSSAGSAIDFYTSDGTASSVFPTNAIHGLTVTDGGIGVGTVTPVASAKAEIASTTKGFLPPRMTTTQKNAISSPAEGLVLYDTTLKKLCVYTGAAWETVTSV